MKITLELVRQVLRESLGFDSFIASFITRVEEDRSHPSAGITKDGRVRYSPQFVQKHVSCKEDLFSLLFHELLHPMFGHFIYQSGPIENIAADAVINSVISTLYPRQSASGNLFKKTHDPRGIEGLMRPLSRLRNSRYERVYDRLYGLGRQEDSPMTTGELIQTLKILTPTEQVSTVFLLGTHGQDGRKEETLAGLPAEILGRMAEEIKQSARRNASQGAGYSQCLMQMLMEALRTQLSIRKVLLQKFATKRKVDKFKETLEQKRIGVSPIPIHPSKRDLVMLEQAFTHVITTTSSADPQRRTEGWPSIWMSPEASKSTCRRSSESCEA